MTTRAPTEIITAAEAARRLGVSRERVRQMLHQGLMAGFRIEGRSRARYVDLSGEGTQHDRILITMQEMAQRTGVTPETVRAWTEKGRLEGFRIEGDRRIYVSVE